MIPGTIKAIVFDLDGTLYVSEAFEHAVWESVSRYAGQLLGLSADAGGRRLKELRDRLTAERGTVQTLAVAIEVLGGTVPEMHRRFAEELEPQQYIQPDPRVRPLVNRLGERYTSWLLTNNNQTLTNKILACLDLEQSFQRVITINDTWRPKPDRSVLDQVLKELGLPSEAVLFVGDRYDIDLRLPEQEGCPVLLTKTIDELMQLQTLLDQPSRSI
ncbi:HAD family hydrolase [Trichlorobacter lovleyi]|uniref:HAD family hydrolase n=1 Tax=Trichlorobacter lovleyi TaxID=313985 RepID=UPI003D0E9BD5